MKTCALTHTGLVMKKNEDRYLIKEMADNSVLLLVADGMGGEAAGDRAAEIVRDKLSDLEIGTKDIEQQLAKLVIDAELVIMKEIKKNSSLKGMGSTVTGVYIHDNIAHWVHAGDSRLYILRDKQLIQVTKDQNMSQFLLDEGKITVEDARNHPLQNLLEQSVGCGYCEPETGHLMIQENDLLILTTDGLNKEINLEITTSILISPTTIENIAKSLIEAAIDAGGKDNITIIIAKIE